MDIFPRGGIDEGELPWGDPYHVGFVLIMQPFDPIWMCSPYESACEGYMACSCELGARELGERMKDHIVDCDCKLVNNALDPAYR